MELKDKIVDLLKKSEPMRAGAIAEALGEDKKLVEKAMKELKAEEAIISPKRCFYSAN